MCRQVLRQSLKVATTVLDLYAQENGCKTCARYLLREQLYGKYETMHCVCTYKQYRRQMRTSEVFYAENKSRMKFHEKTTMPNKKPIYTINRDSGLYSSPRVRPNHLRILIHFQSEIRFARCIFDCMLETRRDYRMAWRSNGPRDFHQK